MVAIGKHAVELRELVKVRDRGIQGTISPRFKHAFKTALAVVIAYAIALYMDWDKPIWAGWTAASVSLDTTGQSIQKGLNRISGAVVGSIAGFVLLAFFIQDRWLFYLFLSLYLAVCTYFSFGTERYNYFWQQAGFFAVVVGLSSAFSPANAFAIAIERTQGAGTGLLVYMLVGLLLWPTNSRRSLEETCRQLTAGMRALFGQSMARLLGRSDVDSSKVAGLAQMQQRLDNLLDAAEVDSWEVHVMRPAWRRCRAQIADLRDTLERWRQDFSELQALDVVNLVPNLPAFGAAIESHLTQIERMFAGDPPAKPPSPMKLEIDAQLRQTLTHFERAALSGSLHRLTHVESVARELNATVSAIRGGFEHYATAAGVNRSAARFTLDRDRLDQALRVAASAWLAFLVVIYVPDVPGELAALGIIIRIVVADTKFAWIPVQALIWPTFPAILFIFPIYALLLPTLSSYAQLAVLLFTFVFVIDYVFHQPKQMLWRIWFMFLFLLLANFKNVQTYSFLQYANTALQWGVLFVLLALTEYLPVSQQPDQVFLRLLARFFRSCEFLMATVGRGAHGGSLSAPWRKRYHAHEITTLPGKLAVWGRFLPSAAHGRTSPEQVNALVVSLQVLSFRMQALIETDALHQSDVLVHELLADVRRWRVAVQKIFGQLADQPETAETAAWQSRLDAVMVRLEARIREALGHIDGAKVSVEESGNMYRLLGAHRGVSEALVTLARQAAGIDWTRLREGRF